MSYRCGMCGHMVADTSHVCIQPVIYSGDATACVSCGGYGCVKCQGSVQAPSWCPSCKAMRDTISTLTKKVEVLREALELLTDYFDETSSVGAIVQQALVATEKE